MLGFRKNAETSCSRCSGGNRGRFVLHKKICCFSMVPGQAAELPSCVQPDPTRTWCGLFFDFDLAISFFFLAVPNTRTYHERVGPGQGMASPIHICRCYRTYHERAGKDVDDSVRPKHICPPIPPGTEDNCPERFSISTNSRIRL